MIDIKVYNAEQIGGCFTVITTSSAKIMIDYGLPLPGAKEEQEDFDWENDTVDAVFITHYHGDHVGKILEIPPEIPIYMGKGTKKILLNIHKALVRVPKYRDEQGRWLRLLNSKQIREVEENVPITDIKDIVISAYRVDHSAYDAYMYLIEADGKVVLHTGDFRGHGYRGPKMLETIHEHVHKDGRMVDYLITEGTMMGDRKNEEVKSEEELQEEATKLFGECKYAFLVISSTNLDSLYSFYKAARAYDMRMYCYNYYFYNQLKTFSDLAEENRDDYQFDLIHTVNFDTPLGEDIWRKPKTQEELMRKHGFLCVIRADDKYHPWIERFKDKNPWVIYSMWDGYINRDKGKDAYNKEWADFFEPYTISGQYKDLHTSGHATAKMIAEVINAVDPKEEIIPMHTENVDGFKELKIDERYKQIVKTYDRKRVSTMQRCKEIIDSIICNQDKKDYFFVSPNRTGNGFTLYVYGSDLVAVSINDDNEMIIDLYQGNEEYDRKSNTIKYGFHDYMVEGENVYQEYKKVNCTNVQDVISFYKSNWEALVKGAYNWALSNCISRSVNNPNYERMRETQIASKNNNLSEMRIAIVAMECPINAGTKLAKPDLIGVYEKNGELVFQYIEYKCTPAGNKGTTLKDHFKDMAEYIDSVELKQSVLKYLKQMIELDYIKIDNKYKEVLETVQIEKIHTEIGFWFSHMKKTHTKSPSGNEKEYVSEHGFRTKYDEMKSYIEENAEEYSHVIDRMKFLFLENESEIVDVEKMLSTVAEWDAGKNRL